MMPKVALRFASIVLLVTLILCYLFPVLFLSPGHLLKEHQAKSIGCFDCHTIFKKVGAANCGICHAVFNVRTLLSNNIADNRNTQQLETHRYWLPEECTFCHQEHQQKKIIDSLLLHRFVNDMAKDKCTLCHNLPMDSLHEQIAPPCTVCHAMDKWENTNYDHQKYYRFDSNHKSHCTDCHLDNDYSRYTCMHCHAHNYLQVKRKHFEYHVADFEQCARCHSGDEANLNIFGY